MIARTMKDLAKNQYGHVFACSTSSSSLSPKLRTIKRSSKWQTHDEWQHSLEPARRNFTLKVCISSHSIANKYKGPLRGLQGARPSYGARRCMPCIRASRTNHSREGYQSSCKMLEGRCIHGFSCVVLFRHTDCVLSCHYRNCFKNLDRIAHGIIYLLSACALI